EHMFIPYYGTIILAGLAAAIIMPRIPPLSKKADTLYDHAVVHEAEPIENNQSLWKRGMREAALRAKEITSFKPVVKGGTHNVLMMWLEVVPVVMAVGTIATMIAEFTPIFHWIGMPLIPLLELLQIPEATEAAQTVVVGFADMFLSALLGIVILTAMTRFMMTFLSFI